MLSASLLKELRAGWDVLILEEAVIEFLLLHLQRAEITDMCNHNPFLYCWELNLELLVRQASILPAEILNSLWLGDGTEGLAHAK